MNRIRHFSTLLFSLTLLFLVGCQPGSEHGQDQKTEESTVTAAVPEPVQEEPAYVNKVPPQELLEAYEAHGGLENWKKMKGLQFVMAQGEDSERQEFDLEMRYSLIIHPDYLIGFDGQDVWVSPNKQLFTKGSPRFYHNLNFYFFCLPFIFSDDGVNYELLPEKEIDGKMYDVVRITFDAGVGDAPKDYYIAHFDQETHLLHLLLYTVTYYKNQISERYNALIYEEWQEVDGLWVPKVMKGYSYLNGQMGEVRYTKTFSAANYDEERPDESDFERPGRAEIEPLPPR